MAMRPKQRHFPEPDYVPCVYGYGRVSHASQLTGVDGKDPHGSLHDQETRIKYYYEMQSKEGMKLHGTVWSGVFLEPKAQSAFSKPFRSRPEGKKLIAKMCPGDHFIVDKLDRMFRDQEDFVLCRRYFVEHGITMHFVEFLGMSGDSNSRGLRLFLNLRVLMAEHESETTSERTRLARSSLRAAGRDDGTTAPCFCYFKGTDPSKKRGHTGKLVMHDWAIPTMEKICWMRDQEKLSFDKIAFVMTRDKTLPDMNRIRCERLYRFYTAWNATGRPDVNTLKLKDFVDSYFARLKCQILNVKPPPPSLLESSVGQE